jgi:hypothetical protein
MPMTPPQYSLYHYAEDYFPNCCPGPHACLHKHPGLTGYEAGLLWINDSMSVLKSLAQKNNQRKHLFWVDFQGRL